MVLRWQFVPEFRFDRDGFVECRLRLFAIQLRLELDGDNPAVLVRCVHEVGLILTISANEVDVRLTGEFCLVDLGLAPYLLKQHSVRVLKEAVAVEAAVVMRIFHNVSPGPQLVRWGHDPPRAWPVNFWETPGMSNVPSATFVFAEWLVEHGIDPSRTGLYSWLDIYEALGRTLGITLQRNGAGEELGSEFWHNGKGVGGRRYSFPPWAIEHYLLNNRQWPTPNQFELFSLDDAADHLRVRKSRVKNEVKLGKLRSFQDFQIPLDGMLEYVKHMDGVFYEPRQMFDESGFAMDKPGWQRVGMPRDRGWRVLWPGEGLHFLNLTRYFR
jgi:hypothetical protein